MNAVFFDLETQKLFRDVGGRDPSKLLLACAATWSTDRKEFRTYWEKDAAALVAELKEAGMVIGFNIVNFDYQVLRPYAGGLNFASVRSLDMLSEIYKKLGFRLSLDSIAKATLGETKAADGLQSVEWFRHGELDKVAEYCRSDVDLTRRVYEFGRDNGFVYYYSRLGSKLKVPVTWR